jgi:hypothetical protein
LTVIKWSPPIFPSNNTLTVKPAPNDECLFDLRASGHAYSNLTASAAAEIIEALNEVFPEISDPNYYVTLYWRDSHRAGVKAGQQDDMCLGPDYASHEEAALARLKRLAFVEDGHFTRLEVKHRGLVKVFNNVSRRPDYVYAVEEVAA